MSAATAALAEPMEECPVCDGSGEVGTGQREWDTGAWVTTTCNLCEGAGVIPVGIAAKCETCRLVVFADDSCPHRHEVLCAACRLEQCQDCVDEARADHSVDVWLDVIRGGAR